MLSSAVLHLPYYVMLHFLYFGHELLINLFITCFGQDMSMCTTTGCNTLEKSFKPLVLKELKKLWNKEDPDLPWEQGEFSPSNTLLVDDSPYKAVCNPVLGSPLFMHL
jgi:hypothetical protein